MQIRLLTIIDENLDSDACHLNSKPRNSGFPILNGKPEYVSIFPVESSCCCEAFASLNERVFAIKALEVPHIFKYYVAPLKAGDVTIVLLFILGRIHAKYFVLEYSVRFLVHLFVCTFPAVFLQ